MLSRVPVHLGQEIEHPEIVGLLAREDGGQAGTRLVDLLLEQEHPCQVRRVLAEFDS